MTNKCVDIFANDGTVNLSSCVRVKAFFGSDCGVEIFSHIPDKHYMDSSTEDAKDDQEKENDVHKAIKTRGDVSGEYEQELGLPGVLRVHAIHMFDKNDMLVVGVHEDTPSSVSIMKFRFLAAANGSLTMDTQPSLLAQEWFMEYKQNEQKYFPHQMTAYTTSHGNRLVAIVKYSSDNDGTYDTTLIDAQTLSTITTIKNPFSSFLNEDTISLATNNESYRHGLIPQGTTKSNKKSQHPFTSTVYWMHYSGAYGSSPCEKVPVDSFQYMEAPGAATEDIYYFVLEDNDTVYPNRTNVCQDYPKYYIDTTETELSEVSQDGLPVENVYVNHAIGYNWFDGQTTTEIKTNIRHIEISEEYDNVHIYTTGVPGSDDRNYIYEDARCLAKYNDIIFEGYPKLDLYFDTIRGNKSTDESHMFADYNETKMLSGELSRAKPIIASKHHDSLFSYGITHNGTIYYMITYRFADKDNTNVMQYGKTIDIMNAESELTATIESQYISDATMIDGFIITSNISDNILTQQKIADLF